MRKRIPIWLIMGLLALALGSALTFLYSKTRERYKADYFENLALLQQMKHQDAEWELNVLKTRIGAHTHYDTVSASLVQLNAQLEQFEAALKMQEHEDSAELIQAVAGLRTAIDEKAELIERFKSHNSVLRNSLTFLPTAAQDVHEALVAGSNNRRELQRALDSVDAVLMDSLIYSEAASDSKVQDIQAQLKRLTNAIARKNGVAERMDLFATHVKTVLREQQAVNRLLGDMTAVHTEKRFSVLDSLLGDELQEASEQVQFHRQNLLIFAIGLITLLLCAGIRLIRSHAVINRINNKLRETNEELERRVEERTRELGNSLTLLNDTLESSTDGILAYRFDTWEICWNTLYKTMWNMPDELLENSRDVERRAAWIAQQTVDPRGFEKEERELQLSCNPNRVCVMELKDGRTVERCVRPQAVGGQTVGWVISFRDITARKRGEAELQAAHRQLLETSRQAGMAEVATGVLHNVGNVLNSLNVSAGLVSENVKKSRAGGLVKVVDMLKEHERDLAAYITSDPKGSLLPEYLAQLSNQLMNEQRGVLKEIESLLTHVDHIKQIVSMQQSYSRISGVKEVVNVAELVEDTLRLNEGELHCQGVQVARDFEDTPEINIEKHKVLQVLVNLVRNAKHACADAGRSDKRIVLRVTANDACVRIAVIDNGVGIAPENLTRIFNHGFTTRKDGHGFGLHSGALSARELGGSLRAYSDGKGQGATFVLELPLQSEAAYV